MYCISTTIKKIYMDKILSGEKQSEFKADTSFWDSRLPVATDVINAGGDVEINFLCGRKSYRFKVNSISYFHNHFMVIDGNECKSYWEIHLGERINESDTPRSKDTGGASTEERR